MEEERCRLLKIEPMTAHIPLFAYDTMQYIISSTIP